MDSNSIHTMVVNNQTGEIVYSKAQVLKAMYKDKKGYLYLNNLYTSLRISPKQSFSKQSLSRLDRSYWVDILMVSKNNVLPPTTELAEHLSLSVRRTYVLIQRLHKCNMVKKKNRVWYANPIYGFHGKWLSPELFNLFRDDLIYHLPSWVVQRFLTDLGE